MNIRVRILKDESCYTKGCYEGATGRITTMADITINGQELTLAFVAVDGLPKDDFFYGGWWYQLTDLLIDAVA